ncbi:MFS transporter [Salaquimonas pukyongi]|uniref:MFS transporter n=1 Tax=Salaquimonas pukyongi TaxID=2712698 RepID=UPI00096B996B|nr:MFS transporter [Salaquimonas pukyongi]
MQAIRPLIPLLIAAGILLAGNGMQGTLIAVRGGQEGFSTALIGLIGAGYFAGFMAGCYVVPHVLQMVGHVRAFAAMAALTASATLALVMLVDPIAWLILRFIIGLCFACLFATVESWINAKVSSDNRGQVLSIYRLVDLVCVVSSQFMIPLFDISGFSVFGVMVIMITLSLVPVSLADRSRPQPPGPFKFDMRFLWHLSPLACVGCIAIGMTGSAFRIIGPVYAQSIGMSVASVATFMSAGIFGGIILQYPLGWLSDRYDRRVALAAASAGAVLAGMFIYLFAGTNETLNFTGIFLFGCFALPLYSLSAAHANDFAKEGEYVLIATGMMFFWSIGAISGPLVASLLMQGFGPGVLFIFTSIVHAALVGMTLWRMTVRATVPRDKRSRFIGLLRTSPMMMKIAKRRD